MPRKSTAKLDDSIAHALGELYERKERGITLIRVLEDYRRFQKPCYRTSRSSSNDALLLPERELARLRMRRAAVDQVIRSIEAYSATQASA